MAYKVMIDPGHGGADPGAVDGERHDKEESPGRALAVGDDLAENGEGLQ
mgnify:CR=1 FL=1